MFAEKSLTDEARSRSTREPCGGRVTARGRFDADACGWSTTPFRGHHVETIARACYRGRRSDVFIGAVCVVGETERSQ